MRGILDYLINLDVANEAGQDITDQVNDMVNGVVGRGGSASGQHRNPTGFDGNRDMNKTSDIFGLRDKGNDNGGDDDQAEDDNPDTGEDNAAGGGDDMGDGTGDTGGDDTGGEDGGDTTDEGDVPGQDDSTGTEDEGNDPKNPTSDRKIYKKNRLRNNAIHFHNILSNNIDSLTNSTSNINDPRTLEVINMVIGNLRDADQQLFQMISTELDKQPYEELLRKYIALRRVYDIGVEMLEKHFSNIKLQIGMKKKPSKAKIKA